MSRREARIARDVERKLREQEKSARLREKVPPRGVRTEQEQNEKQVRVGADPGSIYAMQMIWSCNSPDCIDAWSWGVLRQWSSEDWNHVIRPKLAEFAALTWGEIDRLSSDTGHKMHHNMSTSDICKEAQDRLIEVEQESDVIFRFRLGNRPRLWGFRIVDKFEVLWFDPTHQIFPTDPG